MTTDARSYLGRTVDLVIDRPLGSRHPRCEIIYQLNYGYVPGTLSPDGHELDAWYLGADRPVDRASGHCLAVIHRTNDDDDKLVVVAAHQLDLTDDDIRAATLFVEQYYESVIWR
ncbi:MAG: inorganic pyrophosphatase [Armatimonadetes bacterium]|nr:inorganic pyrophosphatase [Armatimonadota bacterium]